MYKYFCLFIAISISLFKQNYARETENDSLKIITYNIWNGHDWGKDTARHSRMVEWITEQQADVVALQELCGYTQEKLEQDAKAWGHDYAIILKEKGYPTGITSNQPIELKRKELEGFWHGLLQVHTYGIDFFVLHLSPADYETRKREAASIRDYVNESIENGQDYILLGDFNALSPIDADILAGKPKLLERYRTGDQKQKKHKNLLLNEFDFSVISSFLGLPSIDLCHAFVDKEKRYSFPSTILSGLYMKEQEVPFFRQRIDFILSSPKLAKKCIGANIFNGAVEDTISDHYPVVATFALK